MTNPISIQKLRSLISYDPVTGILTWKPRPRVKAGKTAGGLSHGYIGIGVDGHHLYAHRVAWALMVGEWPRETIDHINGDKSDNRWDNLRDAPQKMNSANCGKKKNNKSGFKCVVKDTRGGPSWYAYIHVDRRTKYLGSFPTAKKAHQAYLAEAKARWGEFAKA